MKAKLIFLLALSAACHKPNGIEIVGDVKALGDGTIYLSDVYYWNTKIIDSAQVKNGHFYFAIDPPVDFEPSLVSLWSHDSGIKVFVFNGAHVGLDGKKYSGAAGFMLERGVARISGSMAGYSVLKGEFGNIDIKAGLQTTAYLQNSEFQSLEQNSSPGVYERNCTVIRKYPYSYFLAESLYQNREAFTNEELQHFLALFDADVRQSAWGVKLDRYTLVRKEVAPRNPTWLDTSGSEEIAFAKLGKVNLLVVGASWCLPCREELPCLDSIFRQYAPGGQLTLVSLSIDEDKTNWIRYEQQYKLPWPQLWAGRDSIEAVKDQFGVTSIPTVILYDDQFREVSRWVGTSVEQREQLAGTIKKMILSKF